MAASTSDINIMPLLIVIQEAHAKLESNDKAELFNTLSKLLQEQGTTKRALSVGLRRLPFDQLNGDWTQKKQALEKMLSSSTMPTTPVVTGQAEAICNRTSRSNEPGNENGYR
jgi:hypothetical protein